MTTEICPPHCTCFIEVCTRSFQSFSPLAKQALSPFSSDTSTISVHGIPRTGVPVPPPFTPLWFGNVASDLQLLEIFYQLRAVISLVGHKLLQSIAFRQHTLELFGRFNERLLDRRRIALVGSLNRDANHRSGFQIHGVFGLVSQMRAAVLHLGDAGVRILRVLPVIVGTLLRPLAIYARQILPGRCLNTRFLCQFRQVGLVTVSGIPPYNAAQSRVGFQSGRIHPEGLALHQVRLSEPAQDPGKDCAMRLHIHAPSRAGDRRMIRRILAPLESQEPAQAQRIGSTPGDSSLRIQSLERETSQKTMNEAKQTIVANPDFTGYVDQSPAALGLAICQRTIDPELFRVFAQEIRRWDDLSLTLTVIGASHLVNVEWENGRLSEVLSCATESVPDPAMVLPVRGIVERDIKYKSPSFEYGFNLKLESLLPNAKTLPDHVVPRCADQASASFPSRPGCPNAVYDRRRRLLSRRIDATEARLGASFYRCPGDPIRPLVPVRKPCGG